MSLPRLETATHIADRLNELAAKVKTRSRASLTDANHILENVTKRFFNALFGWDLVDLNFETSNYPAVDLADKERRIAIQVTNENTADKIKRTTAKAVEHNLNEQFERLIVFFLLPQKPSFPRNFTQPLKGPFIETWDIADVTKRLRDISDLKILASAAAILDEELGRGSSRPRSVLASTEELSSVEEEADPMHSITASTE